MQTFRLNVIHLKKLNLFVSLEYSLLLFLLDQEPSNCVHETIVSCVNSSVSRAKWLKVDYGIFQQHLLLVAYKQQIVQSVCNAVWMNFAHCSAGCVVRTVASCIRSMLFMVFARQLPVMVCPAT